MANNYAITSVSHINDTANVSGTVQINGVGSLIPVVVTCNWSAITGQPNTASLEAFLAPLMLAQAVPPTPTVTNIYDNSWSQ